MAKNWYILHTYSGFEKKVAETLKTWIEAKGLRLSSVRLWSPPRT